MVFCVNDAHDLTEWVCDGPDVVLKSQGREVPRWWACGLISFTLNGALGVLILGEPDNEVMPPEGAYAGLLGQGAHPVPRLSTGFELPPHVGPHTEHGRWEGGPGSAVALHGAVVWRERKM